MSTPTADMTARHSPEPEDVQTIDVQTIDVQVTDVVAASLEAYGTDAGSVRVAHQDSRATVGRGALRREDREGAEDLALAPGASRAWGAGERARDEAPDARRTCFEVDLDRIRHSKAFRRLAGKTQVFIAPRNEHLRNRLTHAIEVAQVAGAIARACGLNVALTEAIALGHDCGHGPGGHASEEAFADFLPGGYDHALWGADVTLVELNLCAQTLDGIRNHSWRRPAPSTPEGEVVSWADRIAYVGHDYDDAVRAGLIGAADLPEAIASVLGRSQGSQLGALVDGLLAAVDATGRIGMVPDVAEALDAFRKFNYDRIYLRPSSRTQAERVIVMLRTLVERYIEEPELLDGGIDLVPDSEAAARAAVSWVSGMTDRYAMAAAVELCGFDPARLPRGI